MAADFLLWRSTAKTPPITQRSTKIGIVVPSITGTLLFFLRLLLEEKPGESLDLAVVVHDFPERHNSGLPVTLRVII